MKKHEGTSMTPHNKRGSTARFCKNCGKKRKFVTIDGGHSICACCGNMGGIRT